MQNRLMIEPNKSSASQQSEAGRAGSPLPAERVDLQEAARTE